MHAQDCRAGLVLTALCMLWPLQAVACGSYAASGRVDDDFTCLRSHEDRSRLEQAKYISLGEHNGSYAIVGAELRERVESVADPLLGLGPARGTETVLLQRILLHADVRGAGETRIFVQVGDHRATGRNGRRVPTDDSGLDLQQAFIDIAPQSLPWNMRLRAGRQELAFGSQRLTTTREGPNARLSFDALRATLRSSRWTADAFVGRPILPAAGTFDDRPDPRQRFAGLYSTLQDRRLGPAGGWDLYALVLDRDLARFDAVVGAERRLSLGTRVFGRSGGWDWDWEAVLQRGHFDHESIRAWTLATVTGYTFGSAAGRPRVALSMNVASGDGRAADDRLGTFNPLFPRAPYFTEAAINAPANLMDVRPSIEVTPTSGLSLRFAVDSLWRHRTADAFYAQPLSPLVRGSASRSRYIGTQAELRATWTPTANWVFNTALVHFEAGGVVKDAGGSSQQFVMTSVTLRL